MGGEHRVRIQLPDPPFQVLLIVAEQGLRFVTGHGPAARFDEDPEQEGDDQRRVIGREQAQGGMGGPEMLQVLKIHAVLWLGR